MPRGADWIAHVVQAIEERHEVEVFARKIARHGDLELRVRGRTVLLGMDPRLLHRRGMEVEADESRLGTLSPTISRGIRAHSHVGDSLAVLKLCHDAVERRSQEATRLV